MTYDYPNIWTLESMFQRHNNSYQVAALEEPGKAWLITNHQLPQKDCTHDPFPMTTTAYTEAYTNTFDTSYF